jgi:hypothetical protein
MVFLAELESLTPRMWVRFRFYMGRRRAGEGLPAPPLPRFPVSEENSPINAQGGQQVSSRPRRPRYPAFDLYCTREENLARMQQRLSSYGVLPTFVVRRVWERRQASMENTV